MLNKLFNIDYQSDTTLDFKLDRNPTGYQVRIQIFDPFDPEVGYFDKNVTVDPIDVSKASVAISKDDLGVLSKGRNVFRVYYVNYATNEEFAVVKGEIRLV